MLDLTSVYTARADVVSGYGDDSAVIKIGPGKFMAQNVDVFTPIVDDPFTQGKIAASNITNDLFAVGALELSGMLAFLAAPSDFPKWALADMMNGMQSFMKDLGSSVLGGHTIINPWVLIGGMATAIVDEARIVMHGGVLPGDVLILTKPLGIQPVMALSRLMKQPEALDEVRAFMNDDEMQPLVDRAISLMVTSNKPVVEVIQKLNAKNGFKPHAMTDVTGFGLVGHADNLAVASKVAIDITRIPCMKHALKLSALFGHDMQHGRGAETAGGMLVAIRKDDERAFKNGLSDAGIWNETVGKARECHGTALVSIADDVVFTEV